MEPHYSDEAVTLYHGDCIDVLRELPDCSVDSVVTDPPYGLEFMAKDWDRPWAVNAEAGVGYKGRDGLRLPSHRDSRNANCRACGGRARGAKRCTCASPQWDRHPREDMVAFGAWSQDWAAEALRVLKPGGHLLAFGGTRTWHRLAVAIEDAGFEIRDSIAWMYGSGFPKSLDVSKAIDKAAGAERQMRVNERWADRYPNGPGGNLSGDNRSQHFNQAKRIIGNPLMTSDPATPDAARWQGWGTALKPAHEPIVVARKPLIGTVAANVLAHGTGALNIDATRIGMGDEYDPTKVQRQQASSADTVGGAFGAGSLVGTEIPTYNSKGRWPANVVLDEDQAAALDEQSGYLKPATSRTHHRNRGPFASGNDSIEADNVYADGGGGASRFFYVAKAPAKERPKVDGVAHPTVKPLTLMRWLCRLVTPPGGTILEPFAGSGTTVQAAVTEGFRCIAIEREDDYLPLILSRLTPEESDDDGQLTLDTPA